MDDPYQGILPKFSRSNGLTTGPGPNSEAINLIWKNNDVQHVIDYYKGKNWQAVTPDAFNHKNWDITIDHPPDAEPVVHFRCNISSAEQAFTGQHLENNFDKITLAKHSQYETIVDACSVTLDIPVQRDHFRLWQVGPHVMATGSYDHGVVGPFTTHLIDAFNHRAVQTWVCALEKVELHLLGVTGVGLLLTEFLAIFGSAILVDKLTGHFNAGHIVDQHEPWKAATLASQDWLLHASHKLQQIHRLAVSETWQLTGHSVSWNGLAYEMQ